MSSLSLFLCGLHFQIQEFSGLLGHERPKVILNFSALAKQFFIVGNVPFQSVY